MLKYYNKITKTLTLPSDFNEELKGIPNNTEHIIFSAERYYSKFNQEIKKKVLPISLRTITFGWDFNQEIKENVFPCSIKKIGVYSHCNLINNLPLWITEVYIKFCNNVKYDKEVNNLPMTLERITIKDEKYLKYITKVPFGCDTVIQKID